MSLGAAAAGCEEEDEALELAAAVRARFVGGIVAMFGWQAGNLLVALVPGRDNQTRGARVWVQRHTEADCTFTYFLSRFAASRSVLVPWLFMAEPTLGSKGAEHFGQHTRFQYCSVCVTPPRRK